MIGSLYIFGKFSSKISYYPNNSNATVFENIINHQKAVSQITIHRDSNLMYYCYSRRLEANKIIGFCYVINGEGLSEIGSLFKHFEDIFEQMVHDGIFVCLNHQGKIAVADTKSIETENEELHHLSLKIQNIFENARTIKLPSIDFSIEKNSVKLFNYDETDNNHILEASFKYGYTIILKNSDYNTIRLKNYSATLSDLNQKNVSLKNQLENLESENKKLKEQKKQLKKVSVLTVLLIIGIIGIFSLLNNLNQTKHDFNEAQQTVELQESTINNQESQLTHLQNSNESLNNKIKYLHTQIKELNNEKEEFNELKDKFSVQSFIPISSSIDLSIKKIKFKYYGLRSTTEKLLISVYCVDFIDQAFGDMFIEWHTLTVNPGFNEISLNLPRFDGRFINAYISIGKKIVAGNTN